MNNNYSQKDEAEIKDINKNTSFKIDGLHIQQLFPECILDTDTLREGNAFVNSNIGYFSLDTLYEENLHNKEFYKHMLLSTRFIEYLPNQFSDSNSIFNLEHLRIKNYGDCYIGKFYFPIIPNSAQVRSTVVINPKKKEITIWNFNNFNVSRNGVDCDFRIKGSHTIYKLVYSDQCKSFILYE